MSGAVYPVLTATLTASFSRLTVWTSRTFLYQPKPFGRRTPRPIQSTIRGRIDVDCVTGDTYICWQQLSQGKPLSGRRLVVAASMDAGLRSSLLPWRSGEGRGDDDSLCQEDKTPRQSPTALPAPGALCAGLIAIHRNFLDDRQCASRTTPASLAAPYPTHVLRFLLHSPNPRPISTDATLHYLLACPLGHGASNFARAAPFKYS